MLKQSPSALKRIVMSLKVAALVTVLGTVVLAAERQLAMGVVPEAVVAAAPAYAPPVSASAPAIATQQAPADYFPAQFPEPKGEPAQQPPTF
jgi:hypothetical protein